MNNYKCMYHKNNISQTFSEGDIYYKYILYAIYKTLYLTNLEIAVYSYFHEKDIIVFGLFTFYSKMYSFRPSGVVTSASLLRYWSSLICHLFWYLSFK